MDLTAWKEREFKVTTLALDAQNPRIPEFGSAPTLRQIVAALIEYEDVFELAKSIVQFGGLYPNEALICVEENGEKVVVEGNRRLAALKLLDSPDIAPEGFVAKFRAQKEQISPQAIEKAKVVIAPSREGAAPLIVARHTRGAVKPWLPGQQAKYIRTLIGPDHPIADIAKQINISEAEILKNLRVDTMLSVARVMQLPDEIRAKVGDPRALPVSVLERFIESKAAQNAFGFKFDGDGNLVGEIDESEFKRGFTRFLCDMMKPVSEGGIDTRTLNSAEDIHKYIGALGADKPNKRKKGVFTSTSLLSGKTAAASAARKAASKTVAPVAPRDSAFLVARDFKCNVKAPRIREVFREFRRLKVGDFPNTCGVMLRIFFEMLVTYHLDDSGKMKTLVHGLQKHKTIRNVAEYHPSMTEMMIFVMADPAITITAQSRKVLNRMISDKHSLLSFDDMNAFVHNIHMGPSEKELRRLWNMLGPLMKQLMV